MFKNIDDARNFFVPFKDSSEGSGNGQFNTVQFIIGQTIQFLPISAVHIYYKLKLQRILKIRLKIFQLDIDGDSTFLGRVHFCFEIQQFFHYMSKTTHIFTRPWGRSPTGPRDRPRRPPHDPRTIAPPRGSRPRGARCPCGPCR